MLRVDGISKSFRGLKAVSQASFEVPAGAIVALIGPNGAGKTTCFNMIAGVFAPDTGQIAFEDQIEFVDDLRIHAHPFSVQRRSLFPPLR